MYPSSEPTYGAGRGRGGRAANETAGRGASSLTQQYNGRSDELASAADEGEFESAAILFAESRFIFPKTATAEEEGEDQQRPTRQKAKVQSNTNNKGSKVRGKSAGSVSGKQGGGGGILSLLKK